MTESEFTFKAPESSSLSAPVSPPHPASISTPKRLFFFLAEPLNFLLRFHLHLLFFILFLIAVGGVLITVLDTFLIHFFAVYADYFSIAPPYAGYALLVLRILLWSLYLPVIICCLSVCVACFLQAGNMKFFSLLAHCPQSLFYAYKGLIASLKTLPGILWPIVLVGVLYYLVSKNAAAEAAGLVLLVVLIITAAITLFRLLPSLLSPFLAAGLFIKPEL